MSRRYSRSRDRVEPIGVARMAGDEDQLILRGAVLAPLEVMLDLGRLAVLVDAEKADVEIVARIREVVRIAAVEGDLLLRSEHQANVRVMLETIEVILPALIERDDLALAGSVFFPRLLLDLVR